MMVPSPHDSQGPTDSSGISMKPFMYGEFSMSSAISEILPLVSIGTVNHFLEYILASHKLVH